MSEQVCEVYEFGGQWHAGEMREEVVRCRDCRFYAFTDRSRVFNDDRHNDSYCWRFVDGGRMEVTPDGFCAWAERKVDE